jgi:hypothetical protein
MITMGEGHEPTAGVIARLRRELPRRFPGTTFAFLPADITSQILNFGSPAPIDVQVSARSQGRARLCRKDPGRHRLGSRHRRHPYPAAAKLAGIQHRRQPLAHRAIWCDRARRDQQPGERAGGYVAGGTCLFRQPEQRRAHPVVAQAPEYLVDLVNSLANVPVSGQAGSASQLLGGVAQIRRTATPAVISHYNIQPVFDVYATTSGRDLGGVAGDINKVLASLPRTSPRA